jgi:hypothetical protein
MWQILIEQVGIWWVLLVVLAAILICALTIAFYFAQKNTTKQGHQAFNNLVSSVDALEGYRMENLDTIAGLVEESMNPEFKKLFVRYVEDSVVFFKSVWVPDPRQRLPIPEVLPQNMRAILRKTMGYSVMLGGIAASVLAFSTGYVLSGSLLYGELLRLFAILPVVAGALGMLFLFHAAEVLYQEFRVSWLNLMIALERRLPVYSQASETAAIITQMQNYDGQMAAAVHLLSEQVKVLVSGKLADSVSGAVKQVMTTTLSPSVQKSTDALASLAQEIDKQLKQTDLAVTHLYSDMEHRQQQQAELWHKRYQEISDTLAAQQGEFLKGLATGQKQMTDDLGRSQTFALERIVDEQKQTLQHMNNVAQKSWTILQEKLTLIINQLADGQLKLLTGLTTQQEETLQKISTSSSESSERLQQHYQTILEQMRQTQTDSFKALAEQQVQAFTQSDKNMQQGLTQMQDNLASALKQLSENQSSVMSEIDQRQTLSLQGISNQQTQSLQTISDQQAQSLQTISATQTQSLQTISEQQAAALKEIHSVQTTTLNAVSKKQDDTLAGLIGRIDAALQQMAQRFSGEVSGTLAQYMDPVTSKMMDAADALVAAQNYARDVKDVLKMQSDAATTLQTSIGDLFRQLLETRQAMTEDLHSMQASSGVMSKAADVMGSVYAGSQTGLSEAISQMSNDLMKLSDVLSSVMAGSAEQTRLIQSQSMETYEINQKHLDAIRGQITLLSDELATRIDQLMLGFSSLTEELVKNIDNTINTQNSMLGGNLTSMTDVLSTEARSMSLFAQEINMDIDNLNENLRKAVSEFDNGMRLELTSILGEFDTEVAEVIRRLARAATELSDSVEALPMAIRHAAQASKDVTGSDLPDNQLS